MSSIAEPSAAGRQIYTVPLGAPFLPTLAGAILAGSFDRGGRPASPLDLADYTVILPTRRATRGLQQAFLRASGGKSMLLPAIRAISEGEEELGLIQSAADLGAGAAAGLPPAIGGLERKLALTRLVAGWSEARARVTAAAHDGTEPFTGAAAVTPAQAALLAADLARLMDAVETEGVDLAGLADLVPDHFSAHWQQTIDFLAILTRHWPQYLVERGVASPANRRNALIVAEAQRLRRHPPKGPVIVAGVTGSVPATTELMATVVDMAQGALVLPWLDLALDEPSWQQVATAHPEHPQHGLARLLAALGIERGSVRQLPGDDPGAGRDQRASAMAMRARLVGEVMRPSGTTEAWAPFAADADRDAFRAALAGVFQIVTPTAQDEAEAMRASFIERRFLRLLGP